MADDNPDDVGAALRSLAERLARDHVDGDQLGSYLRGLLNRDRIELNAVCRSEAARLSARATGMRCDAIAAALRNRAKELEIANRRPATRFRVLCRFAVGTGAVVFAYGFESMWQWQGGAVALALGGWLVLAGLSSGSDDADSPDAAAATSSSNLN